jgi:tRNA(adenine34) deaminase
MFDFKYFMKIALKEAIKAYDNNEVPVGAVVVKDNKVIGKGHNMTRSLKDPTAHAEMIAIGAACEFLQSERLSGCEIYVTLEPCPMCAGAILHSRFSQVIFSAYDQKYGACGSVINLFEPKLFNHHVQIVDYIMEEDSVSILKEFFRTKRI